MIKIKDIISNEIAIFIDTPTCQRCRSDLPYKLVGLINSFNPLEIDQYCIYDKKLDKYIMVCKSCYEKTKTNQTVICLA